MQRTLAAVGLIVVAAVLWWWSAQAPGPPPDLPGDASPEAPAGPGPTLAGEAAPPAAQPVDAAPLRVGPAAIRGTVTRDGNPAQATVEIRDLAGANLDIRSLTRPFYASGPPLASTPTAEDGTFRVVDLPVGSYEVRAIGTAGGVAWARAFCRLGDPVARAYLTLFGGPETARARAVHEDGSPFRGWVAAMVGGGRMRAGNLPEVQTDEQGGFEIPGLPRGAFSLRFMELDVSASWFAGLQAPLPEGSVFVIEEGYTTYPGRVVDADTEAPIAGATLEYEGGTAEGRRATGTAVADAAGAFEVRMPSPEARFWVRAEGYATLQGFSKEGEPILFRLSRQGRVVGRVVRKEGGTPVAGVPVHTWNWHTFDVKSPLDVSDEDGRFEGGVGPGQGSVYAFGAGWVSTGLSEMVDRSVAPLTVKADAGSTTEVVLEVVEAGRVEGVVVGADGRPAGGVAVVLQMPQGWGGFNPTFTHEDATIARTGEDGRFTFDLLIPGFTYTAATRPVEGVPGVSAPFRAVAGETQQVEIGVPQARWLPVHVVDKETGRPVEGAYVGASQPSRYSVGGTTGPDGIHRLGPLLPGPLTLTVLHADYLSPSGSAAYARGSPIPDPGPAPEPHVVALERGGFVAGVILGEDGEPVASDSLGLYPVGVAVSAGGLGMVGLRPLSEGGAFRMGPVVKGTYDLALVEQKEMLRYKQISRWTVTTGQEDLRLRVDPALTEKDEEQIVIRIVGPEGKPATAHFRLLTRLEEPINTGWIREEGFVLQGLKPGTEAWLEIRGPKTLDGEPLADVVHGPVTLRRDMPPIELAPAATIAGRVTDPQGAPVVGLVVYAVILMPPELPQHASTFAAPAMRTDEAGRFSLHCATTGARLVLEVPPKYAMIPPLEVSPPRAGLEIRLAPGQTIDVTVLAEEGVPIEGATVRVLPNDVSGIQTGRKAVTDARGVARLEGLAAGSTHVLEIDAPEGRSDLTGERREAWTAASTTVTLPAGRVVEGRVVQRGSPAGWSIVWWQDRRGVWRETHASNDGRFRIVVADGGAVTLVAAPARSSTRAAAGPEVKAQPGDTGVVVKVE